MKRNAQSPNAPVAAKRGRGRPSNAEKARRQAEALMATAAARAPAPVFPEPESEVSAESIRSHLEKLMAIPLPPEPAVAPILPPAPPPPPAEQDVSQLAAHERENPEKLWGSALRDFAWKRGISRSEMTEWTDEKVRQQVKLIIHRQYDHEPLEV